MINIHAIANRIISGIHPNETVTVYQSNGATNIKGRLGATYATPITLRAQIQAASTQQLMSMEQTSRSKDVCKAYLFASKNQVLPLNRPLAKGGDLLKRSDDSWWLVTMILDDFSSVGWVCVELTRQLTGAPTPVQGA